MTVIKNCAYKGSAIIISKSSWQALELIGYLSEVVVLQQLLLRNRRKLLNGAFNKTDLSSSGKKVW